MIFISLLDLSPSCPDDVQEFSRNFFLMVPIHITCVKGGKYRLMTLYLEMLFFYSVFTKFFILNVLLCNYLQPASNDDYIGKIRKRLEEDAVARQEREKRRRKVLVDQIKAHETNEVRDICMKPHSFSCRKRV